MKKPVLFLVGPTAVGKSSLALEISPPLNAEIISADSMQVYRGMNIGTAKPSAKDLKSIPHHLIDILDPTQNFSAFSFYQQAFQAIQDITSRNKIPLVVGGTGFYIRTLIQGIFEELGETGEIRERIEKETNEKGLSFQYSRLKEIDLERSKKIMPNDKKRILRALEIYEVSGKKPSELPESCVSLETLGYQPVIAGLMMEREKLYQNIEKRVSQMLEHGLIDEVLKLRKINLSKTARQAVGYKEILDQLDQSNLNHESKRAIQSKIILNTRHLAKRQITWFKKERGITWFDVQTSRITDLLVTHFKASLTD